MCFIVSLLYLPLPLIPFLSLLFSSLASYICSRRRNEPSCRGGNDQLCKMCAFSGISLACLTANCLFCLSCPQLLSLPLYLSQSLSLSFSLQTVCFVFAVLSFYLTAAVSVRNMLTSLC